MRLHSVRACSDVRSNPGCPRANDWLALVVQLHTEGLKGRASGVRPGANADDITFHVVSEDETQAVQAATAAV